MPVSKLSDQKYPSKLRTVTARRRPGMDGILPSGMTNNQKKLTVKIYYLGDDMETIITTTCFAQKWEDVAELLSVYHAIISVTVSPT